MVEKALGHSDPDLIHLNCFLWEYLKSLVYTTPVGSAEELVALILVVTARVHKIPSAFGSVRQSFTRRCIITVGGRNFQQFL